MVGMVLALISIYYIDQLKHPLMRMQVIQKLRYFFTIAVFGTCGLAACNDDSNTKATDKGMSSDSSQTASTTDSTMKDTAAAAAKPAKKKRMASVVMSPAGTDKIAKDKEGIYNRAEIMPEYPGGQNALSSYINDHLDYSQAAIDDNTSDTLRVSFVVGKNGKVMDVHLLGDKKVGDGLDNQAIKAIANMPNWKPGKVKGENVSTRLQIPITFELGS
jgi:periplasmic protein TonB